MENVQGEITEEMVEIIEKVRKLAHMSLCLSRLGPRVPIHLHCPNPPHLKVSQVVYCTLFAGFMQSRIHNSTFPEILCSFYWNFVIP